MLDIKTPGHGNFIVLLGVDNKFLVIVIEGYFITLLVTL